MKEPSNLITDRHGHVHSIGSAHKPNARLPSLKSGSSRSISMVDRMRTIIIIDDNPSVLGSLSRLLSAHGFHVQTFASAEAFLEGVPKLEADCLLLDIHLGGISGIDLQRQLTSSGTKLPVIFMTAIDCETSRREAHDTGCIAYLKKPFLAKSLLDAIERIG